MSCLLDRLARLGGAREQAPRLAVDSIAPWRREPYESTGSA
jgi:hypothetical protein